MICLVTAGNQASFDLLRSLKATGLDCPVVVVQDAMAIFHQMSSLLTVISREIWIHRKAGRFI